MKKPKSSWETRKRIEIPSSEKGHYFTLSIAPEPLSSHFSSINYLCHNKESHFTFSAKFMTINNMQGNCLEIEKSREQRPTPSKKQQQGCWKN